MSDEENSANLAVAIERRLASEGAQTLEVLVRDRVKMERTTVQRTFHLTRDSHEGQLPQQWWEIFTDAATALQLRPSVLDCSLEQTVRLVNDGADVVFLSGEHGDANDSVSWVLIRKDKKGHLLWWESASGRTHQLKSSRSLRRQLQPIAVDERIRCVAFDWRETSMLRATAQGGPMRPLTRVIHLLQPEWSDIWLVMVFAFVVGLFTLATPIAVEALVNTVAFGRFLQPIVVLALILLLFLGMSAAIKALQTYIVEVIQQRLFARVAGDLAHRLPRTSREENEGKYLPELTNRFFDVVNVQKITAFLLLDGIGLVMSAAIGMVVLGFYHPFLLGFDALLLASVAFLIVVLGRGAVKTAVLESKSKYYMAAWLEDVARCQTVFHTAPGKRLSASRSDRLVHDYLVNRKKHFRVLLRQILFALGLQAFASTVLLGLGGYLVVIGELSLGQLVAAELIVAIIVGAFAKMGKHFESFYDLCASVDKLGALFDLPLARHGSVLQDASEGPAKIEMDRLTYNRKGRKPVFAPLTATIAGGSSTAITGVSGSGKSTLIDIIYGSRRPTAGQILVDGTPPSDLQTDDFWNHVELVRDGEVFASTVEENVHVQRNDVSGQAVDDALEAVGLMPIINALPDGLQTQITSAGSPLASNQVRLLMLARAIASQPNLLIIDGVLDCLPDEDAKRVFDYVQQDHHPWTLIVGTGRHWIAERCEQTIDLPLGVTQTSANQNHGIV